MSPNITMEGEGGLAKMSHDDKFLLVLVKVNKSLCHATQRGGGGEGVRRNVTKCHTGGGGSKKCHVLLEWPLIVLFQSNLGRK